MGEVLERGGDPVDWHHVGRAQVGADERHPFGHELARPLDRLEEVVGAVDLVHLAGLRIPDDDRGAVDAPGDEGLLAHEPLGFELRAVVGRGELLALVEHLLGERPPVGARDGDRGDVVQAARLQRAREFDRVRRAAHVDRRVALGRRCHVIDGREVEEVLDLPPQLRGLLVLEAEPGAARVAEDGNHALGGRGADLDAPAVDQLLQASGGSIAHEHVDLALAVAQQVLGEPPSDEAGRAGEEVGHVSEDRPPGERPPPRSRTSAGVGIVEIVRAGRSRAGVCRRVASVPRDRARRPAWRPRESRPSSKGLDNTVARVYSGLVACQRRHVNYFTYRSGLGLAACGRPFQQLMGSLRERDRVI